MPWADVQCGYLCVLDEFSKKAGALDAVSW
jgi:hypothetical protein